MRYLLVLTLGFGTAASSAWAATDSAPNAAAQPVLLAEDMNDDLLMHPGRDTAGAQRLGSIEIVNPPHESFGIMQKPSGPDQADIRVGPNAEPAVSGPQARANREAVRQERAAAAQAAAIQESPTQAPVTLMPTPTQAAAQAANAQAAGVSAAVSSAATSKAAAQSGGESAAPEPTQSAPEEAAPDQGQGTPDGSAPGGREPAPEIK